MEWGNGFIVKNTGCSWRGLRFDSQHARGSSQRSVTPRPGDPMSSELCRHRHGCWPKQSHIKRERNKSLKDKASETGKVVQ